MRTISKALNCSGVLKRECPWWVATFLSTTKSNVRNWEIKVRLEEKLIERVEKVNDDYKWLGFTFEVSSLCHCIMHERGHTTNVVWQLLFRWFFFDVALDPEDSGFTLERETRIHAIIWLNKTMNKMINCKTKKQWFWKKSELLWRIWNGCCVFLVHCFAKSHMISNDASRRRNLWFFTFHHPSKSLFLMFEQFNTHFWRCR